MSTHPRPQPGWFVPEPFVDDDLGVLLAGKEAQVNVVERTGADGATCLLARKLYLPREVKAKGQLEAMGAVRSSQFRHDVQYREGRQFRKSRDRRAVERMTAHGRSLLQQRWTDHEFTVLSQVWEAGATVPYPVSFGEDAMLMEYVGDHSRAAPQLHAARLDADALALAWDQIVDDLHRVVARGWVHGDLSAYNLLWWHDRVWMIDFPQAVDLAANPAGLDFLHRDVHNVAAWFTRKGHRVDAEASFADLLSSALRA